MPHQDVVLGLDVGTTNVKCLALEESGNVIAQASEPTPQSYPKSGWTDFEPGPLWETACRAIRTVISQLQSREAVKGIAVSSLAESIIPVDSQGEPLASAIAWFDLRTVEEYEFIRERIGYETLFRISGITPDPMFSLCKILWIRNHFPDAFRRARYWLLFADYIAFRLCGVAATDPSLACRTLIYDLKHGDWSSEILEAAGVPASCLPPVRKSGSPLGYVTPASASATNLPTTAVVSVGIHDHLSGAFAAGGLAEGVLFDSIGTSESVIAVCHKPLFNDTVVKNGLAQGAVWIEEPIYYLAGGLQTAGAAVEWFRRELGGAATTSDLVRKAETVDEPVPIFLPHLTRSQTPHPDPRAAAAFVGIKSTTSQAAMFRAILEGIAFEARASAEAIRAAAELPPFERILTIGSSLENRLLTQIKADLHGLPLRINPVRETVSLGAALLAGIGCGVFSDASSAARVARREEIRVEPDPENSKRLQARYEQVYRDLYLHLKTSHHRLHALAR
jgi:xylulokinase